jgi:lysophospholipase L1-like esterase
MTGTPSGSGVRKGTMAPRTGLCFGDSNTYGSIPGEVGGRFARGLRWPGVVADEPSWGANDLERQQ